MKLKNGEEVWIREAEVSDTQALLDYMRALTYETEFLSFVPGEFNYTMASEEQWIKDHQNKAGNLILNAWVKEQLVANLSMGTPGRQKLDHWATLGISVRKAYWGLGLGNILMQKAVDFAKQSGLYSLRLEVFSPNLRAIHLYEKFGFKQVGRFQNAGRLPDGRLMDDLFMELIVNPDAI
ncbi:MAG: GNAT family N-acetyltransferase [Erysipelotrichaceae bacterium]|jgi:RimJ/RimL family protein N-acetyltransferase|nr:GNAT family N-acetyltransferase [Erysipelotrichaceae bacterium]